MSSRRNGSWFTACSIPGVSDERNCDLFFGLTPEGRGGALVALLVDGSPSRSGPFPRADLFDIVSAVWSESELANPKLLLDSLSEALLAFNRASGRYMMASATAIRADYGLRHVRVAGAGDTSCWKVTPKSATVVFPMSVPLSTHRVTGLLGVADARVSETRLELEPDTHLVMMTDGAYWRVRDALDGPDAAQVATADSLLKSGLRNATRDDATLVEVRAPEP